MIVHDAMELARNGWSVVPLRGKAPYTAHGVHDASGDPNMIRGWWARWPSANIGARVPDPLLVFDIDPRNGGQVEALGPLPHTLTCWSGRGDGGRHLYFLRPPGEITSRGLPDGVDLKVNGYCVMPPSLHPDTGLPYRWEMGEIAPLPAALRELLRPQPCPRRAGFGGTASARPLVAFVARHTTDGVNNALYWAGCRAAEAGILDRHLADEMINTAVDVGESEKRARATIASAGKKVAKS